MSTTIAEKMEQAVKAVSSVAQNQSATAATFNPMDTLTERQKIALSSRWAGLSDEVRDRYVEFAQLGITDSAVLYTIHAIKAEADSKIFSESRAVYLMTLAQWYMSLVSADDAMRKFAENELSKLQDMTNGSQQSTLLSALKAKLLDKRTFLPESQERAFRALCRFFGYDVHMIK